MTTTSRSQEVIRLPRMAVEVERALLGACMISDYLPSFSKTVWGLDAHKVIHEAMEELKENGKTISLPTVIEILSTKEMLHKAGGVAYLTSIMEQAGSLDHIKGYEQYIVDRAVKIMVVKECATIAYKSKEMAVVDIDDVTERLQNVIDLSASALKEGEGPKPLKEVIREGLHKLEEARRKGNELIGIPSGFPQLDRMTGGFVDGELIIFAARPSMGKTAFSTQVAMLASELGKKVMFFSLEMSKDQIFTRMIAQRTNVDIMQLRTGTVEDKHFARVISESAELAKLEIFIDDASGLTVSDICVRARKYQPEIVFVDHLGLIKLPSNNVRHDIKIGDVTAALKGLAKELHAPVVLLSQLNRNVELRNNKRPMLSDLRNSGDIEANADLVLLLYRDEVYNPDGNDTGTAEIIIGKNRNGPTGVARLAFLKKSAKFGELYNG